MAPRYPANANALSAANDFFHIISDGLLYKLELGSNYTKYLGNVKDFPYQKKPNVFKRNTHPKIVKQARALL